MDLEALALASPGDEKTALVFADGLQEAGDPRGEVIVLEHALWKRQKAAKQASIEARLSRLAVEHGPRVLGLPGGFPIQRAWGTRRHYVLRDHFAVSDSEELHRVRSFLLRFTNAELAVTLFREHRFRLMHPHTQIQFPFQAGVHYGVAGELGSRLVLTTASDDVELELNVPAECLLEVFELREEMFDTLGVPRLAGRRFERVVTGRAVNGRLYGLPR